MAATASSCSHQAQKSNSILFKLNSHTELEELFGRVTNWLCYNQSIDLFAAAGAIQLQLGGDKRVSLLLLMYVYALAKE